MCELCCLAPQKICWSCQAKRPPDSTPCKYCHALPCTFIVQDKNPPPPPI